MRARFYVRLVLVVTVVLVLGISSLQAQATAPYLRTVIVSPGATQAASGTNLLNAIASITTASASERWLVKIEPGVYDLGATRLQMKQFVDIEGSGVLQTRILGLGLTGSSLTTEGVIQGASNAELRELTVQCVEDETRMGCRLIALTNANPRLYRLILLDSTSFGGHTGIRSSGTSSPMIDEVEITLENGEDDSYGLINAGNIGGGVIRRTRIVVSDNSDRNVGVLNRDAGVPAIFEDNEVLASGGEQAVGIDCLFPVSTGAFTIRDSTITAKGAPTNYAIQGGSYASLTIERSTLGATAGTTNRGLYLPAFANLVRVTHSDVIGSTNTIVTAGEAKVGATGLRGGSVVAGLETCSGVFNGAGTFFTTTCP